MYEKRIARAQKSMRQAGIGWMLLTPSTDLLYLTGIHGGMMERLSCLLLTVTDAHFIGPAFELGNLGEESRRLLHCHGWEDGEDPFALLKRLIGTNPGMAALGRQVPGWVVLPLLAAYPGAAWASADQILVDMRSVKDEQEYHHLKRVHEKSNRAFLRLLEHGLCGMAEREVASLLIEYSAQEGLENPGRPIVASGSNSALPHHPGGERILQAGDVVVLDFGGMERGIGYRADTTRTVAVKRMPPDLPALYDIVLRANQAAFEAAKPGIPCEDVDRAARNVIAAAGYGDYFTHRLGHGLGLDVHEHPYLASGNKALLEAGNVCSDEPGIYIPGKYGIRIEDTLFIHPHGAERLSILDHTLKIVD